MVGRAGHFSPAATMEGMFRADWAATHWPRHFNYGKPLSSPPEKRMERHEAGCWALPLALINLLAARPSPGEREAARGLTRTTRRPHIAQAFTAAARPEFACSSVGQPIARDARQRRATRRPGVRPCPCRRPSRIAVTLSEPSKSEVARMEGTHARRGGQRAAATATAAPVADGATAAPLQAPATAQPKKRTRSGPKSKTSPYVSKGRGRDG